MKDSRDIDHCERCRKELKPNGIVWIEMCTCWQPFGKCGNRDPKHSQGSFTYGMDCAKKLGVKIIKEPIEWTDEEVDYVGIWEAKK